VLSAEVLHQRGVTALNRGRLTPARSLLERARERCRSDDLRARIDASVAYLLAETGDPAGALAICDAALADPVIGDEARGIVSSQRALLLMRQGRAGEALQAFDIAIGWLSDPAELGRARVNRGNAYLQQGRIAEARADFTHAVRDLADAGMTVDSAMARHNLGYCRLLAGDLVGALAEMDGAREVLGPLSPLMRAVVEQDRAEVLMAAGLVDEGRAALQVAARSFARRRLRQSQGEVELTAARALLTLDPAASLVAARTSARLFRRPGADAWLVRADAAVLEAEIALGRVGAGSAPRGDVIARSLDDQGLVARGAGVRLRVVGMLAERGESRPAATRLADIRVSSRAPLAIRLLDRDVRAELAAAQGRRANALQHLRAGLGYLHAWQSSFGSLDLQTGVAGQGVRLGVRGLALAMESRKPEVLFEWSERARMLASRVQPVRAPEDESIVADLAELREIAQARESPRRTSSEREAELRQRVRERAWQHRGSGEVADPVTLAELQGALDVETALVAYVVTADRLVALVVTTDATTWVDVGERAELDTLTGGLLPDLDVAASDLSEAMAVFVRQELAGRLDALAALLVSPVLDAVGDRRVVLTPSGVLAGVPWTLLRGLVGRPVTVAQSATSWLARRTTPLRSASAGFVAGPRIARAEEEVTAAAKEWPDARILVGEQATAAAVSELAASVDVLHVAAHGRHSAQNPMFSGLQLVDGPWFGYDIDQLRSVPDVVLLSACEVGRSTVRWGEELIGMTTAWLHAGARCVIASAAAINDRAANDVLVAVHQQLAAGADPAAALAAAVPAVAAGPSTSTAPVPLVCFG
jgi:tetratricopeptide (TPR) repeat protein